MARGKSRDDAGTNKKGLTRNLGLFNVFCIASGAMISSGLFILVGLASPRVGDAVMLSYALASRRFLPAILSKCELVSEMPKTGGLFFHVDRCLGPAWGTFAGIANWFSIVFKTSFALLGLGIIVTLAIPGISFQQIQYIAVAFCLAFTLLNLLGVKVSGNSQNIMVVVLIAILGAYSLWGLPYVSRGILPKIGFEHIIPIISTAGFVFISFAGVTKIAAIGGEVKNPRKTIPRGIILSWAFVSALYLLVVLVTINIVDTQTLLTSYLPISSGGMTLFGWPGHLLLSIAAVLAFVSTANAGVLTASRVPYAMAKAGLIHPAFETISRHGVPHFAIIFTSAFKILSILLLDLEEFVKTASTVMLLLFILDNVSLISVRKKGLAHYTPSFRSPFFPAIQYLGIVVYGILIMMMGAKQVFFTIFVFGLTLLYYRLFIQKRIRREYARIRKFKKDAGIIPDDYLLDEEIREILIEKDRENQGIESRDFQKKVIREICERLNVCEDVLFKASKNG